MNISGYRDLLFLPDIEHIYMKKREKVKSCYRKRQHLKNAPMLAGENVPKVGGKIHQNQLVGLGSPQLVLVAHQSVLVAHDCNSAIGGQGHSGCTWTVSHGSSSELWISIRIKLNYVEPLSQMGLVKLPHLSVRGSKKPQINDCGVWLVPMVQTQVRVPARADRRTDYCPHTGWHDSPVVIIHVIQWN